MYKGKIIYKISYTPYGTQNLLLPEDCDLKLKTPYDLRIGERWDEETEKKYRKSTQNFSIAIAKLYKELDIIAETKSVLDIERIKNCIEIYNKKISNVFEKYRKEYDDKIIKELENDIEFLLRSVMIRCGVFAFDMFSARIRVLAFCMKCDDMNKEKAHRAYSLYNQYSEKKVYEELMHGKTFIFGIVNFVNYFKKNYKDKYKELMEFIDMDIKYATTPPVNEWKEGVEKFDNIMKKYGVVKNDENDRNSDFKKQFIDDNGNEWLGYSVLRQGRGTNALATASSRRFKEISQLEQLDDDGKLKGMNYFWENPSFGVIIGAPSEEEKNMITSCVAKVQSMIERIFTSKIYHGASNLDIERAAEVHLYLDDYMKEAGLVRKKTAQEHIAQGLYVLVTNPIKWEEEVKARDKEGNLIFQSYKDEKGKAHKKVKMTQFGHISPFLTDINFNPKSKYDIPLIFKDANGREYYKVTINNKLAKYIAHAAIMPFYNDLVKINGNKHPSSMIFGRRLLLNWNMNKGKANENIISVKSLLLTSALPLYEELNRKAVRKLPNGEIRTYNECGSNFTRLIVSPFEKDLDELVNIGMLKYWEYCDSKGKPLSDEKISVKDYAIFVGMYIKYELNKHIIDKAENC